MKKNIILKRQKLNRNRRMKIGNLLKMTIIMRDLMQKPEIAWNGFKKPWTQCYVRRFSGTTPVDWFHHPNRRLFTGFIKYLFDWMGFREAYVWQRKRCRNGVAMLFGHLLTNRAQIFSDAYLLEPEAVKRVTGKENCGRAANGIILNKLRYHWMVRDNKTNEQGEPVMKLTGISQKQK